MAEIARMSPEDQYAYQLSLKHERDYYNREYTIRQESRQEGILEGKEEMILTMLKRNYSVEEIALIAKSTEQHVQQVREKHQL